MSKWQPIETAPTDGAEVMVLCGRKTIRLGWCFRASSKTHGWLDENGRPIEPHHWMPLPALPATES